MKPIKRQTIKIISDKPQYIKNENGQNFAILGIVKDSMEYYCVLYWIKPRSIKDMNNIYIEILDWSREQDINNARLLQIQDDEEFNYIYEQILNYTNFLNEKYIQQVDKNFKTYIERISYLRYDLKPILELENYAKSKAEEDLENSFTNGAYFPPQKCLKNIIEYFKNKTILLSKNNEEYWKHYIALYIEEYKNFYNNKLIKKIKENNDKEILKF